MKYEEAQKIINQNLVVAIHDSDGDNPKYEKEQISALKLAVEALNKQIEIEKAQFTHICKSDNDLYPTTFSIYARLVEDYGKSVTIERFQKFDALPLKSITISKDDFDRYYKPIKESDTK